MGLGNDKELHKYPRGFKQKLSEYYGFKKPRCVLCWSQNRVAIHHHLDMINRDKSIEERYSYYYQLKNDIDWTDLSKFVLLCASCHSKIHSVMMYGGHINGKKAPILYLLNQIIDKAKKS